MYCKNCGQQITDNSTFCTYCGTLQKMPQVINVPKRDVGTQKRSSTIAANEIKKVFNILLISLIIGLLSYPVIYFGVYNANKFENGRMPDINEMSKVYNNPENLEVGNDDENKQLIDNSIKMIKKYYSEKSLEYSLYCFLISLGGILIIRYIIVGVEWVNRNSQSD